jgi:hypothetical protein
LRAIVRTFVGPLVIVAALLKGDSDEAVKHAVELWNEQEEE